ncbi:uncharacterized protein EDB93DRAFT_85654 [Suillus bovinus]|uniref:uncharacterized protein n=1 Tax=Suillus bovinus TaxID=48563 RepID=UPI001B87415D|nr:uncharacterized protein EDB93DRAFT_85654 [Suillus bovinus]KAG2130180.1 hypothetical protein EDB93DRAFT_85654 [Suillus bovinus]
MLFKCIAIFTAGSYTTLAQTIELGFPQNGDTVTSTPVRLFNRLVLGFFFLSFMCHSEGCCTTRNPWHQVGIALAIDSCVNGLCPDPADGSESVLYANTWTPEPTSPLLATTRNLPSLYCLTSQRALLSLRSRTLPHWV